MDFDALRDMVKTITRNKVKNIEVLGNPSEENSMVEAFYDAIAKDKISSDEQAAKFLYGKNESPKSQAYLRLKGRLERSLLNTAFFVDVNQPMFNERAKAFYNCYRDFAAANILLARDARKPGMHIMEQVMEQAVRYEFVDLAADTARVLRRESKNIGNPNLHEKYSKLARAYEEVRRTEATAQEYMEEVIHYYIAKRSPNNNVYAVAKKYYDEMLPKVTSGSSSLFVFYVGNIGLIKCFAGNEIEEALRICENTLADLSKRPNCNRGAIMGFVLQKIACLIQMRQFDGRAEETIAFGLGLEEEGTFNWFRIKELQFHYLMFARSYSEALDVYEKTAQHPKFKLLGGAVRDNWRLYQSYLHLLAALGKLNADKVQKVAGTYEHLTLSSELEIVDDDKPGMNIPVVMLAILRYVATKGNSEDISLEALEKYRRRYLDEELNARSSAFLNMLLAYVRKNFDYAAAGRIIKREKEILASVQPQVAGQTFAVEIVPYEDLWEMLLKK